MCAYSILIQKLHTLGISGTALDWFKSYLSERKQRVDINGTISDSNDVMISILQGNILGPILFLCYINDLYTVTDLLMLMFADDTCLKSDTDLTRLINKVNVEINKIVVWFSANKLVANINKTKYMIFRTKGKNVETNLLEPIYNENEPNSTANFIPTRKIERYPTMKRMRAELKNCLVFSWMNTLTLIIMSNSYAIN
jgi:hypothetical protein